MTFSDVVKTFTLTLNAAIVYLLKSAVMLVIFLKRSIIMQSNTLFVFRIAYLVKTYI